MKTSRDPRARARTRTSLSRRGSALLFAVIGMTTIAIAASAILQASVSTASRSKSDADNLRAFYLAEAGLAEAFDGLRVGKNGQIASEEEPALFGDGLLWVDATKLADDRVNLEATALCGIGTVTLGLIVEKAEPRLGIFSDEALVIPHAMRIDGYDPSTGDEEAPAEPGPVIDPTVGTVATNQKWTDYPSYVDLGLAQYDVEHNVWLYDQTYYQVAGTRGTTLYASAYYESNPYVSGSMPGEPDPDQPAAAGVGGAFALIGSNAGIELGSATEAVEVDGDAIPGVGEDVVLNGGSSVGGSTDARLESVELVPVLVPAMTMQGPVTHQGATPLVISAGQAGYESIDIGADAELIVRGPVTLVIGQLTLQAGASLELDPTDGDIDLFVTGGLELGAGSSLVSTGVEPERVRVHVDSIPTAGGVAPVQLASTGAFFGAIYAPETEVFVGGSFELFGTLVARVIEFEAGARVHYDPACEDDLPKPLAWRIVDVGQGARSMRGNPFDALGVDPNDLVGLDAAHDLELIVLHIKYLDLGRVERSFSGLEGRFDWTQVGKVIAMRREELDTP